MIKNCTIRGGRRADVCFRWVEGGGGGKTSCARVAFDRPGSKKVLTGLVKMKK